MDPMNFKTFVDVDFIGYKTNEYSTEESGIKTVKNTQLV